MATTQLAEFLSLTFASEVQATVTIIFLLLGETMVFSSSGAEDSSDTGNRLRRFRSLFGTDQNRLRTSSTQVL